MASRKPGRPWSSLTRSGRRRKGSPHSGSADTVSTDIDEWTRSVAGYVFADKELLNLSRAHRSWCSERGALPSNERLEFLGDSILQWVITEWMYRTHPDQSEGVLSDLRKSLVNTDTLADTARRIGLGEWLLLGVGEDAAGGRNKSSILADAFEAFIGAIYLDGGAEAARRFVLELFEQQGEGRIERLDEFDARSHLIRVCVREFGRPPKLEISSRGAAHEPTFSAEVVINDEVMGSAQGRSKKAAAQAASSLALAKLEVRGVDTGRA